MKFSLIAVTLAAISGLIFAYPHPDSHGVYTRATYDDNVTFVIRAMWGQGKYTMDEHDYHSLVKPGLIAAFTKEYPKFAAWCGSNPDFHCDRKGMISATAVDKKKAATCTHAKVPALPLGDTHVLPYTRAPSSDSSRSSSPEPHSPETHHRRSYIDIFDDLD